MGDIDGLFDLVMINKIKDVRRSINIASNFFILKSVLLEKNATKILPDLAFLAADLI